MKRMAMEQLVKWKESPYRKPLILKGVRQVGKTWLLKEFGKTHYENVAYFNFDENPEYRDFFRASKSIGRLIPNLAMAGGVEIHPRTTLLIFDEVQDSPEVLNALKYFRENAPEYHVACAGSLLGIALAKPSSFPVGQVDFLSLYPMTFEEFLEADGSANLSAYMRQVDVLSPLPVPFYTQMVEKLRLYFITGGMPEVVKQWVETRSADLVQTTLFNILNAYERDFAKHPEPREYPKISLVWRSLPSQLVRENKKFLYSVVKGGARAREYEDALQWLVDAALVYKVFRIRAPGLPLSAYDDLSAFKIYLSDVGILRRLANLDPSIFREGNRMFSEFKGALTENFILQSLVPQFDVMPRYWSRINPPYEVDFVVQRRNDIIPIEVKADKNIESRSLKKYAETFPDETKLRVRFSLENLKFDGGLLNIPLFMADEADRLMGLAMEQT